MPTQIQLVPLGEFRMGAEGFGVRVYADSGNVECLSDEIVFSKPPEAVTSNWHEAFLDSSFDGIFLIIRGIFTTFVLNLENLSLSLFKDTIRTEDGVWCEETAIFG